MRPTLMIVEDDRELQELFCAMLDTLECEIALADDGA